MKTLSRIFILAALCAAQMSCKLTFIKKEPVPMEDIRTVKGKTVMVVTPHPDDDTFLCGGTLAYLAKNGNKIIIVIYTNDNAGSTDPEMTNEKLAKIRKVEEEEACAVLGIPKENIVWLGYNDGMLEYADKRELTKQVSREIRKYRPDILFTIDPGVTYDQWHKTDHRTAAIVTTDAMRASNWRLYWPEIEKEGYPAWSVPVAYFYYTADPNITVDITDVIDLKIHASAAHFSQFGDAVAKYNPHYTKEEKEALAKKFLTGYEDIIQKKKDRYIERFRRAEGYGM